MRNKSMHVILGVMSCVFFMIACGGGSGSDTPSAAPNIYLAQSTIDFAGIVKGNYIDRTFIIKNTGSADLNIGQISPPALPFSISSDTGSNKTLAPSETCSLMVRFSPASQGSSTGTFSIPSNDPDSPTVNVALKGEGYGLNVWINQFDIKLCQDNHRDIYMDVSVTDSNEPLVNLKHEPPDNDNFIFKLNGGVQPFDLITNPIQEPVSVVLALDLSGSLTDYLDAIKDAAISFIDLLGPTDEAAICKFKAEADFYPETGLILTTNDPIVGGKVFLNDYIDDPFDMTDGTALYNAVYDSIDRAAEGTVGNKLVVIVLSDGQNNITGNTLDGVIGHAIERKIPVFTIFYVDSIEYPNATNDNMLRLAEDTRGQFYNSTGDKSELQDIFEQISDILSNKYTIKFLSPCTGSIDLEVRADYDGFYGLDSRTIDLP